MLEFPFRRDKKSKIKNERTLIPAIINSGRKQCINLIIQILREKLSESNTKKTVDYDTNLDENKAKVVVPKLKLDILPNYHKKSEKSLNESLLAVYH